MNGKKVKVEVQVRGCALLCDKQDSLSRLLAVHSISPAVGPPLLNCFNSFKSISSPVTKPFYYNSILVILHYLQLCDIRRVLCLFL